MVVPRVPFPVRLTDRSGAPKINTTSRGPLAAAGRVLGVIEAHPLRAGGPGYARELRRNGSDCHSRRLQCGPREGV